MLASNIFDCRFIHFLLAKYNLTNKEGKFKGRLKKYHKNHAGMNYAVKLYKEGGMTVNQICEITNVSRASLYRKLSEGNK